MTHCAVKTGVMVVTVLIAINTVFAQLTLSQPEIVAQDEIPHSRFVAIVSGFYGFVYPAGSIYTSDNYLKREKGKYFGATQAIGYELSPYFILHGGFTLWDGKATITRHVLTQEMKTQYSIDTCALHTGILFVYKWFFADAIVYTELPLERDTERVQLNGVYMQTNLLQEQYEHGGFVGCGVRVPVFKWFDMLIGVYGGGSFVPSIITTKHDELYFINASLRMGVIVYFPNEEKKI